MKARLLIAAAMLVFMLPVTVGAAEPKSFIEAKAAVRDILRDPASAQFKYLKFHSGPVPWVSGMFNAKNSFGGYTDFEKFVYIIEMRYIITEKMQAELMTSESKGPAGKNGVQYDLYKKYFIDEW